MYFIVIYSKWLTRRHRSHEFGLHSNSAPELFTVGAPSDLGDGKKTTQTNLWQSNDGHRRYRTAPGFLKERADSFCFIA